MGDPVVAFRLAPELVARIDQYAAELAEEQRLRVSRNAAVVRLLTDALDAHDSRPGRPDRPPARRRR